MSPLSPPSSPPVYPYRCVELFISFSAILIKINMSDVNFIKHAVAFHRHIPENKELTPFHISLYYTLFHEWNDTRFDPEFRIVRNDIMDLARIGSANTYRNYLHDLNKWNYLDYLPSQSKYRPSTIRMHRLDIVKPETILTLPHYAEVKADAGADRGNDPHAVKRDRGSGSTPDRPVRAYNTNNSNTANATKQTGEREHAPTPGEQVDDTLLPPAAEKKSEPGAAACTPTNVEEVIAFFVSVQSSEFEAKKFYYHYKSNGWKVGAAPMDDWQAAAHKWILYPDKFTNAQRPTPGSLQTPGVRGQKKKYGPL
jgi:hypothetical protein